jgi:hypothetical protein
MKYIVFVPFAMLASCASIVSKTSYPVNITSSPAGCHVTVKDQNGSVVHQGTTPTSVKLSARGGYFKPARYSFEFSKRGLPSQTVNLTAEMDGWYFGNVLIGGLIGMLVVDPATGAMWQLPENVNAHLTPIASISNGRGNILQVVDRSTLPAGLDSQLVALR